MARVYLTGEEAVKHNGNVSYNDLVNYSTPKTRSYGEDGGGSGGQNNSNVFAPKKKTNPLDRFTIPSTLDSQAHSDYWKNWANGNKNNPNTGSSYGGSSGGGGYASQPQYNALDSYMSYINQQKEAERAAREALKQQRIDVANSSYGAGMQNLNVATDSAMQQAYIKKMQEQRDLPQQMQAMGVSGGATESSMANLANVYGTNRADINKANLQEQSALEQAKAAAIAAAESDTINNEMQANRDYSQGLMTQYASAMQNNAAAAKANSSTSTKQPSVQGTAGYKLGYEFIKNGGKGEALNDYYAGIGYSDASIADYLYALGLL